MTGYVYILRCADHSYYTGSTNNIEARLWQHQNGQGANHTRKHLPVELVFVEQFDRIDDAFAREKQIQGWSRKKKEALMQGDFNQLHLLAVCKNNSHYAGGFDSAQPPGNKHSLTESGNKHSLTEAEHKHSLSSANGTQSSLNPVSGTYRSLSGVEGSEIEGNNESGTDDD
ncbi:GIY-YIG nuclease family protein [Methylotuvimicrobium sp. KM1]|uniref:GIY-YIG nuclease family protein n=1 Tax=Methylotuvimicrobium sp. KM1 TaxID=3377707 RepID=UPI00384CF503